MVVVVVVSLDAPLSAGGVAHVNGAFPSPVAALDRCQSCAASGTIRQLVDWPVICGWWAGSYRSASFLHSMVALIRGSLRAGRAVARASLLRKVSWFIRRTGSGLERRRGRLSQGKLARTQRRGRS